MKKFDILSFINSTVTAFFVLATTIASFAQDTIRISAFGISANSRINTVPFINKALAQATGKPTVILFDKGRYDFWADHCTEKNYYEANTTIVNPRICPIFIFKKQNIVVDGNGAEFIFHGRMQPFTVDSSTNITIKNLSVDWEIPFGAEAEIAEVTPEYFDLNIDPHQYPHIIENDKLWFVGEGWKSMWGGVKWNDPMQFDKGTLNVTAETDDDLLGGNWERKYTAKEIQPGLVRIFLKNTKLLKQGNWLNLRHSVRDHAGVFMTDSKDISLQNINMYNNTGMNFLAQYTENISYKNVHCIPNPARRKILAGHDDGLHHTNCKGLVSVDGCSFRGIMDDAFNVHNTYVLVKEKLSTNKLLCQFKHHQSLGFVWGRKGEQVSFIKTQSMNPVGSATIKSYKILKPELFEIEFDAAIPPSITVDDALENLTWNPSVEIKNCHFGQHRARAILVSTPEKVWIHDNVFESSGAAICIPGDANHWYEGGAVTDVSITRNIFRNCNSSAYQFSEGIISVQPGIPKLDLTLPAFHRNIRVTENTFEVFDAPILYVVNVDGFTFSNNTIKGSTRYEPRHADKPMMTFDACFNVAVEGNKIGHDILSRKVQLVKTKRPNLVLGKNQGLKLLTQHVRK